MESIAVYVIFFNEKGELTDGLETYVNFVPAKGKSAFEVNGFETKSPTRIEAYAIPNSWSILQA